MNMNRKAVLEVVNKITVKHSAETREIGMRQQFARKGWREKECESAACQ